MESGAVRVRFLVLFASLLTVLACARQGQTGDKPQVIAVETFLADVAGRVSGGLLSVEALLPIGIDPHGYQPMPRDVARVADAALVIVNGAGFEGFLDELVRNASDSGRGGGPKIVEASAGLAPRAGNPADGRDHGDIDPHFFMDPVLMIDYARNIADAFSALDAKNAKTYRANADAYAEELRALDRWIAAQVETLPRDKRLLVTNHESLGYFADRYGFTVVGTILPGASSLASASARQLARLTERIKGSGAKAIFLETGASAKLAEQVAAEAGIRTITGLYTHSLSGPEGPAATYIDMMKYDARAIVEGLR